MAKKATKKTTAKKTTTKKTKAKKTTKAKKAKTKSPVAKRAARAQRVREKLLDILKARRKEYTSGEVLAKELRKATRLPITRAGVWKHIQALRKEGHEIESRPRSGYRLVRVAPRRKSK